MINKLTSQPSYLFVSSDKFPPFRPDVVILFAEKLTEKGHKIDWLLQSDEACRKGFEKKWHGGRVQVGATNLGKTKLSRLHKHILALLHDLKMFKILKQGDHDFIIVKDKFISALFAICAVIIHKKKFIFWLSYPFPEASLYSARTGTARYPFFYLIRGEVLGLILYRLILPCAKHIFVQSEQMKKDICFHGIRPEKVTSVPMGVKIEDIPFCGYSKEEKKNEKLIVYLGTLIRLRKIDFLVRVLAEVVKGGVNTQLLFVGGGEDAQDEDIILSESERLGLSERVRITGFLPREKALELVAEADVCLSPYYPTPILNSTSPTKLIEYMALGKAVVANDHPEQKLVLNESQAGLCVSWDEKEFSGAIKQILDNPDEKKAMGERGRKYVERKRTYDIIADIVENELLKIKCKE
jgi:glycosyltransferase involved in cell wall biosynthesis